jgi:hypothetical protein
VGLIVCLDAVGRKIFNCLCQELNPRRLARSLSYADSRISRSIFIEIKIFLIIIGEINKTLCACEAQFLRKAEADQ